MFVDLFSIEESKLSRTMELIAFISSYTYNKQITMLLRLFIITLCFFPLILVAQDMPPVIIEEEVVKEFAPDFEMTMEDGSTKQLSDFKGQVVYLSFWASWCKPCINGFNKYRGMREEMENLGVVMLNVSIDESPEKWKIAINEHNPTGIHALVPHNVVQNPYQMYSVPLYEIVGKEGQFLYLSDEPGRNILANFQQFIDQ